MSDRMTVRFKRDCPQCLGHGSITSWDSDGEPSWKCRECNGTGKVKDCIINVYDVEIETENK